MTIATKTIKLFGQTNKVFQVVSKGQVVHVAATKEEAQEWISKQ